MGSQNGKQQSTMTHNQSSLIKKKIIKSKDTLLNSSFGTKNYEDRISAGKFNHHYNFFQLHFF